MQTPQPPDPDHEIAVFEPVRPTILEGLEQATELAYQFFENLGEEEPVDPHLFPDLVRFHLKRFLKRHLKERAATEGTVDFRLESIANNGIKITFRSTSGERRAYRLWKSGGPWVPAPGPSEAKLAFLNQEGIEGAEGTQAPLPWPDDFGIFLVEYNVTLLWGVDRKYRFNRLYLTVTQSATETGVSVYWEPVRLDSLNPPDAGSGTQPDMPDQPNAGDDADLPFVDRDRADEAAEDS